jgi:hypothetical protein
MLKKSTVILLALGSILLGAWHLVEYALKWNSEFIVNDMVSSWDKRMAGLRADLPADIKVIGYVGNWDILPEDDYVYADEETEFVLTQYALSPVIVKRDDNEKWVVLNLSAKAYDIWLQRQPRDIKVTDYGLRIFLVHKP